MKKQLVMWPDCKRPDASTDADTTKWSPNTFLNRYGDIKTSNISGTVDCNNVYKECDFGQSVTVEGKGNPYNNVDGHKSTRQTKGRDVQWSSHWIGPTDGLPMDGDKVSGPNLKVAVIASKFQCSFMRRVVGFICDISSIPDGSGSESDGSGRCEKWNISASYVNAKGEVKILNMCEAGIKLKGHTYDSVPSSSFSWYQMSYALHRDDQDLVFNQDLRHIGWCIQYKHHKYTGGDNKSKYCTGRVRYLQPLIGDALHASVKDRFQLQPHYFTTWTDAQKHGRQRLYTY